MIKTVIIQGSSRSKGDTWRVVNYLQLNYELNVIDLKTKTIGHYDYEYKNQNDDFLEVVPQIIKEYDLIIFATPVYWYTMSGHMKVFFDRISDLLRVHKDLGRQLRGKSMAMISTSNSDDLIPGFNMPFVESAKYLGMNYAGDIHTWISSDLIPDDVRNRLDRFMKTLNVPQ